MNRGPLPEELTVCIASYPSPRVPIGALCEARLGGGHQCLYVLRFSNGVTKVGRTSAPRRRVKQHVVEARRWDVDFEAGWLSAPFVADASALERRLVGLCRMAAADRPRGTEYFTGLSFEDARQLALAITPVGPLDRLVRSEPRPAAGDALAAMSPHRLLTVDAGCRAARSTSSDRTAHSWRTASRRA